MKKKFIFAVLSLPLIFNTVSAESINKTLMCPQNFIGQYKPGDSVGKNGWFFMSQPWGIKPVIFSGAVTTNVLRGLKPMPSMMPTIFCKVYGEVAATKKTSSEPVYYVSRVIGKAGQNIINLVTTPVTVSGQPGWHVTYDVD